MRAPRLLAAFLGALLLATPATLHAQDHHITGTVYRSSGEPATSVWVTLFQGDLEMGRCLTGDDGRYYVGGLERGRYRIVVTDGRRDVYQARVELPRNRQYDIHLR